MSYIAQTISRSSCKIVLILALAGLAAALTFISAKADSSWSPDDPVAPLPGGCIRGTPAGEPVPLCCMSGIVYLAGRPVSGATVTISDAQGEVASVYTQEHVGTETRPYYYVDLSRLMIHDIDGLREITPTDVITLVATFNGIHTTPMIYSVEPGGQNVNLNLYDSLALSPGDEYSGDSVVGKFQYISGADIDSQGNLFLWDLGNGRMQVVTPDGQWLARPNWQKQFGYLPYQVYGVNDLAIARGGSGTDRIYLADPDRIGNADRRRIEVYTADGDFIRAFPDDGYARSLDTDAAGNLYSSTQNAGLVRYDAKADEIVNVRDGIWSVSAAREISVTPAGDVFVANPNGSRYEIYKLSRDLKSPAVPFHLQTVSGEPLNTPGEIAVADDGHLYVYDYETHQLFDFDSNGVERAHWSWNEWNLNNLSISSGTKVRLVISGIYVYVVSQYDGVVIQIDRMSPTGTQPRWMLGGRENEANSVAEPTDLAVSPIDNSLYIADQYTGRLSRMVSGKITQTWTAAELGQPSTSVPTAIDFMPGGDLLVVYSSHALQRFHYDPASSSLVAVTPAYGTLGSEPGQFYGPASVGSDNDGFVYVADTENNRVQVLQEKGPDGFAPKAILPAVAASGIISRPIGIAVDRKATPTVVYVVDDAYKHIASFTFDGTQFIFQQLVGSADPANGQIVGPRQVEVASDGSLWATDYWFHVHRRSPGGQWQTYGDGYSPALNSFAIAVDAQNTVYLGSWNYGLISTFKPMEEGDPVASIVRMSANDLVAGDTLVAIGSGQVASANSQIARYEWSAPTESNYISTTFSIVTTTPIITIPTIIGDTQENALGTGMHLLQLRVQDTNGKWSTPVSTTLYVADFSPITHTEIISEPIGETFPPLPTTCEAGRKWTFLLYLDADNSRDGQDLRARYMHVVQELTSLHHPCIQIAVQIDGPASIANLNTKDTIRRIIQPGTAVAPDELSEESMDSADALTSFLRWGYKRAPANHYYLVIADHGNGFQGIAFDETSGGANWGWGEYLSASEIRTALGAPGVPHIDILHLDACSMALIDVAYELRDSADYLIASQYVGWSFFEYDDYARYVTAFTPPSELAKAIVRRYAYLSHKANLPYTVSALDLRHITPLKDAIDQLAVDLKSWVNTDDQSLGRHRMLFTGIRGASQFFDSNSNFLNTPRDGYVDIEDFARLVQHTIESPDIQQDVAAVLAEFNSNDEDRLILQESHMTGMLPPQYAGGVEIPLLRASGLSLYFPANSEALPPLPPDPGEATAAIAAVEPFSTVYVEYIAKQSFEFARATRWSDFLHASLGQPAPGAALVEPQPPLAPRPPATSKVYLPLVTNRTR